MRARPRWPRPRPEIAARPLAVRPGAERLPERLLRLGVALANFAHQTGERLDVLPASSFRQRLAVLHDVHEKFGTRLGLVALFELHASLSEQRLGAANRIFERSKSLVHFDGSAERFATLGRGPARIAIGM
jgi:hypothetical protein